MNNWSIEKAKETYNISYWGQGYFDINANGNVVATPDINSPHLQIDLSLLADSLQEKGASLPILVRFPDILHHRVDSLCSAFNQSIKNYNYQNHYLAVFPIKVNQQGTVVDEILASQYARGQKQLGLEAGSKPELMAVLAMAQKASSVIICNGYKDREYIRLALIGEKLGHQVFIVLEKMSELVLVLEEAKDLKVTPRLGIRMRLASQGKGKWQSSGGDKSKFGLSASQVLRVVSALKERDCINSLQLLHFHLGSQIADIRDVRKGITEAAKCYVELRKLGVPVTTMDVGGGLAVDYEGTRSQSHCSMNYSIHEYANNIVYTIGDMCQQYQEDMPRIMSESGRNLTAHHAVLLTDVIGVEHYEAEEIAEPEKGAPQQLLNMWQGWEELYDCRNHRSLVEIYHDTQSDLAEIHTLFSMDVISLKERAWAEQVALRIYYELGQKLSTRYRAHRDILDELNGKLADKFFVNFSLFQSLPDAWGIDQLFPVLPLSNLDQEPERRAIMLDITCDSDGTIDHYVEGQGIESTLPVPKWDQQHPYRLGFFLVGAYQETLGNLHNLFGDTDSAIVRLEDNGDYVIEELRLGDTVQDVMQYVHLDANAFLDSYTELVNTHLPENERSSVLQELENGLQGYTYLEDIN